MRTRSFSRTRKCPWYTFSTKRGDYSLANDKASIKPYSQLESYIQDVHPSKKQDFNPVYHVRSSAAAFEGKFLYEYEPPKSPCILTIHGGARYVAPSPSTSLNWGGALDELAAGLSGRIQDSCMVLLSLKELGDTYKMFRNPFNLLKPSNWRKVSKQHPARTLASKGANVWLEYLYGWKSFYSDLTSFSKSCGSAMIDYIQSGYAQEVLSRFSSTTTNSGTHPNAYFGYSAFSDAAWANNLARVPSEMQQSDLRICNIHWSQSGRVGCWCLNRCFSPLNKMSRILARFDIASYQSLRDLLWEVIPFSFVIDWFVDCRGIWSPMNRMIISQSAQKWLGYSTTTLTQYDVEFMPGSFQPLRNLGGDWGGMPVAVSDRVVRSGHAGVHKVYQRVAGLPPTYDFHNVLENRGLSLTQCLSGLSLIAQRIL